MQMPLKALLQIFLFTALLSACGSPGPLPRPPALLSKTDSDVSARRESQSIDQAFLSPEGSLVYSYLRDQAVELSNWSSNPVRRSLASNLWYRPAGAEPSEFASKERLNTRSQIFWIDAERIAWLDEGQREIVTLNLRNSERGTLYRGEGLDDLQQHGGKLYFYERQASTSFYQLSRLDTASREVSRQNLPRGIYVYPRELQIIDADTAVITLAKFGNTQGEYRTATSPPPAIFDSYLFSLSSGTSERLAVGLDRNGSETVTVASDKYRVLLQKQTSGEVFDRAGGLRFSFSGQGQWLDDGTLLVLNASGLSRFDAQSQKISELTRSGCTDFWPLSQGQALVACTSDGSAGLYRYRNDQLESLLSLKKPVADFFFKPQENWN